MLYKLCPKKVKYLSGPLRPSPGLLCPSTHPQAAPVQQELGQELPMEPMATAEVSWSPVSVGTSQEAALSYHIVPVLGWEP